MRQLYLFFESQKWSPTGTKLTISHIRELFCLSDSEEINYYVTTVLKYNLTRDELKEKIRNKEYERLPEETKIKLSMKQR